jgi:hypothetical protein
VSNQSFAISDTLRGRFASHDNNRLCIIFYRGANRVSSFCADGCRTDYMSEKTEESSHHGLTLAEAIALAEKE